MKTTTFASLTVKSVIVYTITCFLAGLLASGCAIARESPSAPTSAAVAVPGSVSFNLDPALGSSYETMAIAENNNPDQGYIEIHPAYNEATIKNYPLPGTSFTPRIAVFPIQRYRGLSPELVPARVADLQSLLAGEVSGNDTLPFLPILNAAQIFTAQVKLINFQNGKGIRYLTQYAQGIVPVNNQEMIYTFQGLTADNQYWVSVILPISHRDLPAGSANPPDGQSMEDFAKNYLAYKADITAWLNAQAPDKFIPSIDKLDALVKSIMIQP